MGPGPEAPSGGEGGHLQGDPLPQLLGLLPPLEVLQHIVELHHSHRRQAERAAGAADDVDEVVVVSRGQVDEPVMDVLWTEGRQVGTSTSCQTRSEYQSQDSWLWTSGEEKPRGLILRGTSGPRGRPVPAGRPVGSAAPAGGRQVFAGVRGRGRG